MQKLIEQIITRQPFEREQLSTDPADWYVEVEQDAQALGLTAEELGQQVADTLADEEIMDALLEVL